MAPDPPSPPPRRPKPGLIAAVGAAVALAVVVAIVVIAGSGGDDGCDVEAGELVRRSPVPGYLFVPLPEQTEQLLIDALNPGEGQDITVRSVERERRQVGVVAGVAGAEPEEIITWTDRDFQPVDIGGKRGFRGEQKSGGRRFVVFVGRSGCAAFVVMGSPERTARRLATALAAGAP